MRILRRSGFERFFSDAVCIALFAALLIGCSASDCPQGSNANSLFCHRRGDAGDIATDIAMDTPLDTRADAADAADRADVPVDARCGSDADCATTERCDTASGRCVPRCTMDSDCASSERCDIPTGRCVPRCTMDSDCPATDRCDTVSGRCVPRCTMDTDCTGSDVCDTVTGHCRPGCRTNADCTGTPMTPVCHPTRHVCVECSAHTDCPTGEICVSDACVAGCTDSTRCPAGNMCCSMACVDTQTSVTNCGACGTACMIPHATPACTGGACEIGTCDTGYANCDSMTPNGCETNTQVDVMNCGSCGTVCNLPNAMSTCTAGTCTVTTCTPGFANCDSIDSNGCETPLGTNTNCGSCGNMCPTGQICAGGTCRLDCGALMICSGACVDTMTSATNCGACGTTCPTPPNSTPTCTGGTCGFTCNAPFANCDGMAANGCEVNTQSDANHCGMCGHVCTLPNATSRCTGGGCVINTCNPGFADCDGVASNGCEVNVLTSTNNCGTCGNMCALANATAACAAGGCVIASCNPGFSNCDSITANGCETPLGTVTNCSGCGASCPARANATPVCTGSTCSFTCIAPFANCDGLPSNGCETNTSNSVFSCGSCGNACSRAHASANCVSSSCRIGTCDPGWANCDGVDANGCETDLNSDANCGSCGNNCGGPGAGYCYAGSCAPWPVQTLFGNNGPNCADMGPDNSTSFFFTNTIRGRPGATIVRRCQHMSCGGLPYDCGIPGITTIPASGQIDYTDYGGMNCTLDPGCTNGIAGNFRTWVEIDGHPSDYYFFTFFNSCCPSYQTCASAGGFCPSCYPGCP